MQAIFVLFAVAAGVFSALQSGSNNVLQKGLAAPWWTILIVSATTAAVSLVAALASGERLPSDGAVASVPWYGWIGGVFGLAFVLGTVFASPKLGAGVFVALVVTASTVASLALDHFGLMGFDVHRVGWGRLAGALLMAVGVSLIARF
ncbi:DMT family transporter [Sphingomonas nostoxanthinifaciens]|uniref:DMT family transporter n=1 Tax=Sphingomonas nostoxanthinifaciens TaxID=2872652 RepID=UPI001CC1F3AF|nr:DMT family transporter [Sphingomonas nostoxanthinifaciens]UAK26081.1 DMT family transporter [Sphingomonas nostoxanthinifaciens]